MYVVFQTHGGAAAIERMSLDGKDRKVLVDEKYVVYPSGLYHMVEVLKLS